MGDFLNSAWQVLRDEGHPLNHRELARLAVERGYLATGGKTPWQTMKSKLSTDILRRREASPFMRTSRGLFGLRAWNLDRQEYVADRFQRALLDEDVLVFDSSLLGRYLFAPGIQQLSAQHAQDLISQCQPMRRSLAESLTTVIQLVSVFVVRFGNKFLTYKRTRRLPESRLHHFYSINFGGHLNPDDIPSLLNFFDPSTGGAFLERELSEEVRLPERQVTFSHLGVIWDDRVAISRQHLGIAYEVETRSPNYEIGERGFLMDSRWESLDEINARLSDFENWSELLARHEYQRVLARRE
jgi:predicted NUDIX family phosphoesterase